MKIFISATHKSRQFVAKLTPVLKRVGLVCWPDPPVGEDWAQHIKDGICDADILLIVVGEGFEDSVNAKTELHMALALSARDNRQSLFPVILDDNPIPDELKAILCARCRSDSDEDVQHLSAQLQKAIADKKERLSILNEKARKLQRKHVDKYSAIVGVTTAIMSIFTVIISFFWEKTTVSTVFGSGLLLAIIAALISVTLVMGITTYTTAIKRRKYMEEKEEEEQYSKKLKAAIAPEDSTINIEKIDSDCVNIHYHQVDAGADAMDNSASGSENGALRLMLINLENIKEFYTWSQKQAKGSFTLAVSMCIAGFVMMIAAILLPIVFELDIGMAIIPAIGGAIAELIAGTALFVYKSSLSQLNHYHKALHEDERFLSSVNLLNRFSTTEMQDEMLKEIIRSEIQMNLLSITKSDDKTASPKDTAKKKDSD
ncbi:MAG: toll/interleukin-1 receptor domain-containing protein [Oscillospiraceae bacterium]|nr:toll/interleukin-1 receptor domain-containing protein [Oscillospiraceae bacterium]